MDAEQLLDFVGLLDRIREGFASRCVPFFVPIGEGPGFSGIVDVLDPPAERPGACPMAPGEAYQMLVEQIVETDESLMERYLNGETIPPAELRAAAHGAIIRGTLIPVVCLSARKDIGLKETLSLLAEISLTPFELHRHGHNTPGDAEDVELEPHEEGELVAPGLQDLSNDPVHGQDELPPHPLGQDHPRHDAGEPPHGQDRPAGAPSYRLQGKTQEEVSRSARSPAT